MVRKTFSKIKTFESVLKNGSKKVTEFKELFLKTPDNKKIAVNHYKTGHKEVVVLAHGWFMTKDSRSFSVMSEIFSADYDVVSMDFRGHGRSSGLYTFSSKEYIDLKTVIDFVKEKDYEKIYLIGFSLGAATSLIHCAAHNDIDKLIVVSAPHSFEKIENHMWKKEAWIPTLKKLELRRMFSVRPSLLVRKKIKPIDIVEKIKVPTLFIAGSKDPTVHCWHTQSLHERAICEKQFELFEDCFHAEDLFLHETTRFIKICKAWFKR